MAEVRVEIPEDLASEFGVLPDVDLSILVSRVLREKLSRLARFKQIVSKSKLTEKQAEEVANKISESLAKRYDELA